MVDHVALVARLRDRRFPWTLLRLVAVFSTVTLVLVAVSVAFAQARKPAPCEGPWPNCEAGPIETVLLIGFLVYLPGLLLVAAVLGVAELFGPRLQLVRSAVALAAAGCALVLALMFLVGAVA